MIPTNSIPFHALSVDSSIQRLESSYDGLKEQDVIYRHVEYGYNEIQGKEKESPLKILLSQFANILIIVLIISSAISALMGEMVEAVSILVIVLLAGILGFFQEYRAGKAIEALKRMAAPMARVIRGGKEYSIASRELVPGDIIVLKTGDTIPADSRIIESVNLLTEESPLTGESRGVEKKANLVLQENIIIGDRLNMVFSRTTMSMGRGKAVVAATGNDTEFGKIAQMLSAEPDKKTPLQRNLDKLGSRIGIFALIIAVVMGIGGILKGYSIMSMFVWGVALAVAVIPEALPAVVTISLALGVRRMVKRKALVRKLPAVETLGSVNIICSDKTGTLTEDKMTVRKLFMDGKIISVSGNGYSPTGDFVHDGKDYNISRDPFQQLAMIGVLCNDSRIEKEKTWTVVGDPTEGAILVLAMKSGVDIDTLKEKYPREDEIPFSSDTKRMTTFHTINNHYTAFSKGAGEVILKSCNRILENGGIREMDDDYKKDLEQIIQSLGKDSLRVIGMSFKDDDHMIKETSESNMVFVGFAAMIDPPRPEAITAIQKCKEAGIKPVMITGDHKVTAVAIAREMHILSDGMAFSGEEIEKMSDEEFKEAVDKAEVFARISPAHKVKIVDELIAKNNIVAMTGDGVNDAPSLKKANIGIAMGITGTDVSKEAADMILTDDNFASIVSAVEEGRTIFENIRKYLVYLLSGNMGTVFAIIGSMIANLPLPLTAVQILFINFVMDGLIAIALGVEGPEQGIMNKKPRNTNEGIINMTALTDITLIGLVIAFMSFAVYGFSLKSGMSTIEAGTMFFLTLITARLFNSIACRSLNRSIFAINPVSNSYLLFSIFITLALVFVIMGNEFFHKTFRVEPVSAGQWLLIVKAAFMVIVITEIIKLIKFLITASRR